MSVKDIIDQTDFTDEQKTEIVENIEAASSYIVPNDLETGTYIEKSTIGNEVAQLIVDKNLSYDKAAVISKFDYLTQKEDFNSSDVEVLSRAIDTGFSPDQLSAVLSANTTETREVAVNIIEEARVGADEDNPIDTAGIDKAEFVIERLEQGSIDLTLKYFGVATEGADNSQLGRVADDLYNTYEKSPYFDNKDIDKSEVAGRVADIMPGIKEYFVDTKDIADIVIAGKVLGEEKEDTNAKIITALENADYTGYVPGEELAAEEYAIQVLAEEYIDNVTTEYGIEIEKDEWGDINTYDAMSVISLIYSHEDKAEEIVDKYNSGMSVDEIKESFDYDIYKDLDANDFEYNVEVIGEQINIEIDTGNGYKVGILDEGGDGYVRVIILDEDGDPVYDTGIADDVVICSPSEAVDFCKEVAELPSIVDNDSDNIENKEDSNSPEDRIAYLEAKMEAIEKVSYEKGAQDGSLCAEENAVSYYEVIQHNIKEYDNLLEDIKNDKYSTEELKEIAEGPYSHIDSYSDSVDTDEEPVSISEYIEGIKEGISEINDKIEELQDKLETLVFNDDIKETTEAINEAYKEKEELLDEHQEKLETALEEAKEAEDEDSINEIESGLDFISSERGEDESDPATGD